jgi:hypothetical protein
MMHIYGEQLELFDSHDHSHLERWENPDGTYSPMAAMAGRSTDETLAWLALKSRVVFDEGRLHKDITKQDAELPDLNKAS